MTIEATASVWKDFDVNFASSSSRALAASMTTLSAVNISEADYCAIEDTLYASEKGRRFLRAYVDRHRSVESLRLIRSISRLHRTALGTPGCEAELVRDLTSLLKSVSRNRQKAADCESDAARSSLLVSTLEEMEASLISLIESMEERAFGWLQDTPKLLPHTPFGGEGEPCEASSELFSELSSSFTAE